MPPTGWKRVQVGQVCESIVDCVNKTAPVVDEPTPYKMIRTTNVRNGWVNLDEVRSVTEEVYARWTRRQVPRRGDVILTREAPLGEVGLLRSDDTVFLGQRLVSYRADPTKLDNRFLLYAFLSYDVQSQIKSLGSGATVEHMRVPDAEKLTVLLPALPIQRRIADILSAYDDLIENNTKRIKILEEMARSLYREWFVNFRFPGHEKVKMVSSRLGKVPEGWEVSTLERVSAFISRGVSPKYDDEGPEIVINQKCIRDQRLSLEPARRHRSKVSPEKYLQKGDVLINSTGVGTLGRVAQVLEEPSAWTVDSHVTIARPKPNVDTTFYGLLVLSQQKHFEEAGVGATGQTELNRTRVGGTEVVVPPRDVAASFGAKAGSLRNLSLCLDKRNRVLRETRDLILPRLISGEVSVDPTG